MELTVYGTDATCPGADGACSCFLLTSGRTRILLEMGCGSLPRLQREVDLARLDAIVISHLHFDHFGDLFCAKYQLESRAAWGETIRPIPLFTPALPPWAAGELCTNGVFDHRVIRDGMGASVGGVELGFVEVVHLVESYAVAAVADGRRLVYSGDSGRCPALGRAAAGADLLLCEATLVEGMRAEEGHHLQAASAGRLAAQSGAKRLLLTHYHSRRADQTLAQARAHFPAAALARAGERWQV